MKSLNNRAGSHLSGQVESELDSMGNGGWVNHGYCESPEPRGVSTIYSPPPFLQGPVDSIYRLDAAGKFPEPSSVQSEKKKSGGCCSFIKGLWGTALTENISNNREKYIRTTLRELLVYLVFLLDICLCESLH
ncbi:polycystic kidney disease 2-like 1 protein [Oryzias melastigma]|uniref:polycystic kidney disease 2-like 1 protein n=1 Tax=Oryzias melastigma TaxID=30732 RepID=UPI00168D9A90|nr:polycystic kidney disease 2-like 1 protein [Oryzias melastigma]